MKNLVKYSCFVAAVLYPQLSLAVGSAELYSSKSYGYGRYEARLRYAPADGVVSAFFLWKDGSEKAGTFWNELDFEKVGPECNIQSNAIYGNPSANHNKKHTIQADLCGTFHTYTYEWTPDAVVWLVDGAEIRRDTGATPQAFAENASAGMQFHFNLWPGDSTFGGTLNPSSLPVHQYIDWVQFSTYQDNVFTLSWREDFTANTLPTGWLTGNWGSPKNLSTHAPENVNFIDGYAVLSLTADNALGPAGAMPGGSGGANSGTAGAGGAASTSGGSTSASGGSTSASGTTSVGGSSTSAAGAPNSAAGSGVAIGGGSPSAAGAPGSVNGPTPTGTSSDGDSGCSFGPAPARNAFWWALALPALALVRRNSRRTRGASHRE